MKEPNYGEYRQSVLDGVSTKKQIQELKERYQELARKLLLSLGSCKKNLTAKTWNGFAEAYARFCGGLMITVTIGRDGGEKLARLLSGSGLPENKIHETIAAITYPSEHTPLMSSQIDLLLIGAEVQKRKTGAKRIEILLKKWVEKHGVIPVNFCDEPWTLGDAKQQLADLLKKDCERELGEVRRSHARKVKEAKSLIRKIGNKEVETIACAIAEGTYLNEFRKNVFSRVSLGFRPIFEKIARKGGSKDWRDCFYLRAEEMEDMLRGKKLSLRKIVGERKVIGHYVDDEGVPRLMDPETVDRFYDHIRAIQGGGDKQSEVGRDEVNGVSANGGVVRGIVKVVLDSKDFSKFKRGDVLVATMTSVDFVPIMEKAAAFITNEGGITSHASIVAREMNKPCIIGTKIATQVLKDGDLVEVDADKGVVRVLGQETSPGSQDLVKKYDLASSTWTHKGLHGVLHTFFPLGRTCWGMKDFFGDGDRFTIFFVKNNYVYWYWKDTELTRIREVFLKRLAKDRNYLEKLIKQWRVRIARFDAVLAKLDKLDFSKLSDEKLAEWYDRFFEAYTDEYKYFMVLGDAISMHADRYFVPVFEKVLGRDFATVFPQLLTTNYLSFVEEENIDRHKLITTFKKRGTMSKALLEKHAAKYFYIQNNYAKGVRLTSKDFEQLIREDAKTDIDSPQDIRKENEARKRALIKKYKISSWNRILLYVMEAFFEIQDTRKKYVLIASPYEFRFMEEAVRRSSISQDLVKCSVYPEYRDVLRGSVDRGMLREREKISMCVHREGEYEIFGGEVAEQVFAYFQNTGEKKNELKGMIAAPGKARGRVKVVLKFHDAVNMEKGDILVSSMTRPEMVPAMKLAAAIITDEGGVTSHAAIVSREMGIPCIIGTKIATQILKDGDLVEVDADKGVVRILDKK